MDQQPFGLPPEKRRRPAQGPVRPRVSAIGGSSREPCRGTGLSDRGRHGARPRYTLGLAELYKMWYMYDMADVHTISAARYQLFELFAAVTGEDGRRVVISHRRSKKRAVLVSESYIELLEKRARKRASSGEPFSLFGSATLNVPPEDVLAQTRAAQQQLARAKQDKLETAAAKEGS